MPSPSLASPSNPRIKAGARLRDRRTRESTGLTIVDGAREVRRAIDAGADVVEAFVCEALLGGADARAALDALRQRRTPLVSTTEAAFAKVAFGERAEGIVAVVRAPSTELAALTLPADPLLVVVEDVEKPGNLGAILRSADGVGADALIAASPRTDLANPNVIRASAGTVFTVPLAAGPTPDVLAWLRARQVRIVAARVGGGRAYTEADLRGPLAIALGSEADGLSDAWAGADVEPIHLPMHGIADSLNVSVTAAVLLYEARRQRDHDSERGD
ncbi:MAG TPA: RNA methyltransferase [Candidatus Limnocylindrales bacterium]|nr:RNA methyltransferase [Candidatus Limnocylindrales bacterium]